MLKKELLYKIFFVLLLILGNACQKTSANDVTIMTPSVAETATGSSPIEDSVQGTSANVTPSLAETVTGSSLIEDSVTINLAVEEFNLSYYKPLIAQFEQVHPNIQVRLLSTGDVTATDTERLRAMASSFDVFPYYLNRQSGTQYLLDLQPLLALDPQFEKDDFLPSLLPEATNSLWSIPTGAMYQLTYFNKIAFDASSLPYPGLVWTTDDFLASALALTITIREEGEVTRWGYVPGQLRYSPLLATLLNVPLQSGEELRLTDSDVVTAVQWVSDLFTLHQVSPWLETYKPVERQTDNSDPSVMTLINGGTAAMWHSTHLLYDVSKEHIGVTAVPHGENGFAAEPIITGFAISRGTRSPEAAWQLVSFLSRQLPPDETGLPTSTPVPARRSVAAATGYWEQLPAELATALKYTAENSQPSRISYAATGPLLEAFALHIDENVPVATALEQVTTAVVSESDPVATEIIVVEEPKPEVAENAVQINFTTYSYLFDRHQLLSEEFQREYPNIIVNVQRPDDIPGVSNQESLMVSNSDCFVEQSLYRLNSELRGAVLLVDPLLEIESAIQIDDFYPVQISYFTQEGGLWAIPAFTWTQLIEYNRDLFLEANMPEPSLDWTLMDFLETAQLMTEGSGESKQYGYAESFSYLIDSGIPSFNAQYINNNVDVPTFDYESATEMITWYADLVRLHRIQPPLSGNPVTDYAQFENL